MNKKLLIEWMRFYSKIIGINIWNGSILYLKVAVAAGGVEAARGFDIRTIPPNTIFWTWISTIIVHVVTELSKHLMPNPPAPPPGPT
jgi:hypothetical protein